MNVEFHAERKLIEEIGKARESSARLHVEIGLPETASARNRCLLALHERGLREERTFRRGRWWGRR